LNGSSFSLELALGSLTARRTIEGFLRRLTPDRVDASGTELIHPAALRDVAEPTVLSMQEVLTE